MSFVLRAEGVSSQAGFVALAGLRKPWIERFMVQGGRTIPVVSTRLSPADRWGSLRVRWGLGRMRYSVLPGLYAAGSPTAQSPVFVSANYKLSFDSLRSALSGLDCWILVLDTKGINVWCAAGKGSFGTGELVSRLSSLKLRDIVSHRSLVLPQLGASGVSAPEVMRRSGFRVEWGPVRASDIKAWLAAGRRKDEAMRRVTFTFRDRMRVAPVELVHAWPLFPAALALGALSGLPLGPGWLRRALPLFSLLAGAVPVGTLLFPALLPWLPSRAFVVKGGFLGLAWALLCAWLFRLPLLFGAGAVLLAAPIVGFLAMNFTGASTYTSQPGALLEVEKSFWPMLASALVGLAALVAARLAGL